MDATTDASTDVGTDSPTGSEEAGDASSDVAPDVTNDAPDAADAGDPCTVATADPNVGVFVSHSSGNDGPSCGTLIDPCLTIQRGLDLAAGVVPLVYVQQGTYAESITLHPGLTVVGGWQASWVKDTSANADALVVLQPSSGTSTVVATQLSASSRMCTLTVLSKAQANPGESLYGVFATGPGASLALDDVVIVVGNAGDGIPGDGGAAAPDASAGGGCAAGDGGAGVPVMGGGGSPGMVGTFTSQGYVATPGASGQPGGAGSNGADGGAPPCVTCYSGCGTLCITSGGTTECGMRGSSGCGGVGGQPGAGGGGGGSSVGIYAWQTTVQVAKGRITVGNGGNGGTGGPGSAGGAGGAGAAGSPGASCTTGCAGCGLACCSPVQGQPAGGSAGGPGGKGGAGGAGGGGAGGSSCATATAGDAGAVITTSTMTTTGDAGTGAGGAPNGVSATECQ